jgi:ABC-type sugar transport system permease subunit
MRTITFGQLRHFWPIYLLILPAVGLILTFSYFPAASATYHAFFRWNGDEISEYIRLANFKRALEDPVLGRSFRLVMILLAANLVKMVPSIITAVVIHRLASARSRYLYRVAFVIPMIIPQMVWLLMWKFFYNPMVGVLNGLLRGRPMVVLQRLDAAAPALAQTIIPYRDAVLEPLFGAVVLGFLGGLRGMVKGWLWWLGLLVGAVLLWGPPAEGVSLWGWGWSFWQNTLRQLGFWHGLMRMAHLLVLVGCVAELVRRRPAGRTAIKWTGSLILAVFALLVVTSATWTEPTKAFDRDPGWLSDYVLIVPALIFWGFPWVGVVSVLLYLSGLGNIDQSVYEAADIDGCGPFRKFWNIELPLIMTQIRLNLVLMVIATLKGWGLVFILLGDDGGTGGVGMLPGLYMFRKAFRDMEVGYACAIGLLLFFLIVYLTVINNRYVRVSK